MSKSFSNSESCAPAAKWNGYSCFSRESLEELANSSNLKLNTNIDTDLPTKELYKSLKENLSDRCNTETCWVNFRQATNW